MIYRVFAFFFGFMFGVSSVVAQEITFSWSGIVPVASSELDKSIAAKSSHVEAIELLSSKQESHPQLVMSHVTHEATNTEIQVLKTEL
ncbi:hypothetical protein [Vibrio parahaemolyticus]|uniref:hypothetical protein n=1 Tax=Vibrio parahaemolyticus TaxID=670 RepID=UPI00389259E4